MSRILFGQSYYLRFDPKLWDAMHPYPPLGTLYAAAYLRQRGYDVALFDAMLAESEDEWAAALDREKPQYAVIYEDNFNYLSKMCLTRMRQAAFTMIDMARSRGCTVIVCGSDATDHAPAYLHQSAHYVLVGEGEETLSELLCHLSGQGDKPLDEIVGLATPENPRPARRPVIKDLDSLPMPAWDLVDVERYRALWLDRHGYYSMNMATTRGCPYHCNWCAKPIWGQRYNVHSPQYVAEQLAHLKAEYQPDHIWFADDIMGLKPGWIERYADLIERSDSRLPFKCLSRADLLLRGDTVDALKRAGCDIVWIGAESGSQKILDAMEKGTTIEQIRQATTKLHAAGVKVGFFLQFGYPGETRADIEKTLQLVRDCQPDDVGISVSYPLPGTPFYDRVKDQLGVQHNWIDSSDLAMLYTGPFATAFYRQLHTVVHKEFRARKTWNGLKRTLRQPGTLRARQLRDTAAMFYHTLTLPLARWKLDRLASLPHQGITTLPPGMGHTAAATPTPQHDEQN
jgi:anaerobic magnesium-protoporphyrin IX monomethyl ester cyclase